MLIQLASESWLKGFNQSCISEIQKFPIKVLKSSLNFAMCTINT